MHDFFGAILASQFIETTSFFHGSGEINGINTCGDPALGTLYHDGVNALPVTGDQLYEDSLGNIKFSGVPNSYMGISTTSTSSTSQHIQISGGGEVINTGDCP